MYEVSRGKGKQPYFVACWQNPIWACILKIDFIINSLLCTILSALMISYWSFLFTNAVFVSIDLPLELRTPLKLLLFLQAGVAKLNEAKALVDELKRRAAEQSVLLKTKQQEADSALQEITTSMQVCVWFCVYVYACDSVYVSVCNFDTQWQAG